MVTMIKKLLLAIKRKFLKNYECEVLPKGKYFNRVEFKCVRTYSKRHVIKLLTRNYSVITIRRIK